MSICIDPNSYVDSKYVGIPWKAGGRDAQGIDCLGLGWLYVTDHGLKVPDTDGLPVPRDWKKQDAERLMREILRYGDIAPIHKLKQFDVVLFVLSDERSRMPDHVAVMVNHSCFLHILENGKSQVTRIDEFWKSRLAGAIRLTTKRVLLPEGLEVRPKL